MNTQMTQDFYELLGTSRDASEAEIKKAYRRKARELHPDVSEDTDAEAKFRRATEAYEVLSDSEKRKIYDQYGEDGLRSGGWDPRQGAAGFGSIADIFGALFGEDIFSQASTGARSSGARGEDVHLAVELDFRDAALGTERELTYEAPAACKQCSGKGAVSSEGIVSCDTCAGHGVVRQVARSIFGQVVQERICPTCVGRGEKIIDPCSKCSGTGEEPETKTVQVSIPAGIQAGQRIRLTGRGGIGSNGAAAGNLYVDIHVEEDERFIREGDDLVTVLDLSIAEAALGTTAEVGTVDGDTHSIEIPHGTQPGTRVVIRGRGVGRLHAGNDTRGDLIVFCNVRVPYELNDAQRSALLDFSKVDDPKSYNEKEGIFDKLKRMVKP